MLRLALAGKHITAHRERGYVVPKYALLIYGDSSHLDELDQLFGPFSNDTILAHKHFATQIDRQGAKLITGAPLEPPATATSIHLDSHITDGPFIKSANTLDGFYIIEAYDLDHAIEIAKLCPAPNGGVEVRPVAELPDTALAP